MLIGDLPPLPFGYEITALPTEHEGNGHVYLTDANGRKIASIWGKPAEKMALAELVIDASKRLAETRRVHALAAEDAE